MIAFELPALEKWKDMEGRCTLKYTTHQNWYSTCHLDFVWKLMTNMLVCQTSTTFLLNVLAGMSRSCSLSFCEDLSHASGILGVNFLLRESLHVASLSVAYRGGVSILGAMTWLTKNLAFLTTTTCSKTTPNLMRIHLDPATSHPSSC